MAYIRNWLGEFLSALGREILAAFDQILKEIS